MKANNKHIININWKTRIQEVGKNSINHYMKLGTKFILKIKITPSKNSNTSWFKEKKEAIEKLYDGRSQSLKFRAVLKYFHDLLNSKIN